MMKPRIQRRLLTACVSLSLLLPVLCTSSVAMAAYDSDLTNDARMEGFKGTVALDVGTGVYFFLFLFLCVLGSAVMFKDAKRAPK